MQVAKKDMRNTDCGRLFGMVSRVLCLLWLILSWEPFDSDVGNGFHG